LKLVQEMERPTIRKCPSMLMDGSRAQGPG
jgi:hypothetical protein